MTQHEPHISFRVETEAKFKRRRLARRIASVVIIVCTLGPAATAEAAPVACANTHLC